MVRPILKCLIWYGVGCTGFYVISQHGENLPVVLLTLLIAATFIAFIGFASTAQGDEPGER